MRVTVLAAAALAAVVVSGCKMMKPEGLEESSGPPLDGGTGLTTPEDPDPGTPNPKSDGGDDSGPAVTGCNTVATEDDVVIDGFHTDRFTWYDANCQVRTAALVRNDKLDPAGKYGGYLRRYSYRIGDQSRVCTGSSNDHPGWGYTMNHYGSSASSNRDNPGKFIPLLRRRHHVIHRFQWVQRIQGQDVDITIHWFFATGKSHPIWAVTYDMRKAPANAIDADTRAPYGDIQWDGDNTRADVDGVGWGDRYKFISTTTPLTFSSGWDYTQPNTIPYVFAWSNGADAEMGAVQTQPYTQHDAGGYMFYASWGKTSPSGMPPDWNWTYQVNQYEIPFTLKSKRLAWGSNYGAVGQTVVKVYGDDKTYSGHPFNSYSVYAVLDRHSEHPVFEQVAQVETAQRTTLTATTGTVITSGQPGVARPDTGNYARPGYNPVYGTWEVQATSSQAVVKLDVGSGVLLNPILVVKNYLGTSLPTRVELNGKKLVQDVDYFPSLDTPTSTVWITFNSSFIGSNQIRVAP